MIRSPRHRSPRIALVSLGCPKNLVDSEVILGGLAGRFDIVREPAEADVALVNTCGFIDAARRESYEVIEELVDLKRKGRLRGVIVAGCMVKRFRDHLERILPEVDAFLGISDYSETAAAVRGILRGRDVGQLRGGKPRRATTDLGRALLTPPHVAYLRVSEGCDCRCTFCVIPSIRGRMRSKPVDVLEEEASQLVSLGVKELVLVAEDTTAYGRDLGIRSGLVTLLQRLEPLDGLEWIRILYAHPLTLDRACIEEMVRNSKVLRYLDMPVQHANDGVLREMRRGTTQSMLEDRIALLRDKIEGIALRTSVIVGFPGETQGAFEDLLEFVDRARFARLGCFVYSSEEGSPAAALADSVEESTKEARCSEVMLLQRDLVEQRNRSLEGRRIAVILDDQRGPVFVGRSEADAPDIDCQVIVSGEGRVGEIHQAMVTGSEGYDLRCELLP